MKEIKDMILVIKESPELFHDGIDEEIIDVLTKADYEIEKSEKIIEDDRKFTICRMEEWLTYKKRISRALEFIEKEWKCDGTPIDDVIAILQGDKDGC